MEIIKKYWYVATYTIILSIFLIIGLPHLQLGNFELENLSLENLTNIQDYEFKFSPTLDFGEYTEYIYSNFNISGSSQDIIESEVRQVRNILDHVGLNDSNVYAINNNQDQVSIIIETPGNARKLSALNNELQRSGPIDILQLAPLSEENTETTQQFQTPEFIPSPFSVDDIRSVAISNQPINGGYGLVIEFNPEIRDQLLIGSFSEVNQNQNDQLFLAVGGQPYAGQATALDLNSENTRIFFRTNVGNDIFATRYLQYATQNKSFDVNLTPQDSIEKNSILQEYRFYIGISVLIIILATLGSIFKIDRKLGYYLSIIVLPAIIIFFGLGKIINIPISFEGLLGFLLSIFLLITFALTERTKREKSIERKLIINSALTGLIYFAISSTPFTGALNVITIFIFTNISLILNIILIKPFINSVIETE